MRSLLVVACALLAGCGDDLDPLGSGVSCQQEEYLNESGMPQMLDVVIAISDRTTMQPRRARVLEELRLLGRALAEGGFDVHVSLLDIGGLTSGDAPCGGQPVVDYFKDWELPWWSCPDGACGQRNYDGDLGERLACAVRPFDQSTTPPLIQRVADAADEPGFARRDAALGIVVISDGDDASPQPVGVYVDRILRSRDDPSRIWMTSATGDDTPRLDQLRAIASLGQQQDDLDADAWTGLPWFTQRQEALGIACLEEGTVDVDEQTPGVQPDCVLFDDGAEVPPCPMAGPDLPAPEVLPCWWTQQHDWGCAAPILERDRERPWLSARMSCACALESTR